MARLAALNELSCTGGALLWREALITKWRRNWPHD
jgi:hypothetical protein